MRGSFCRPFHLRAPLWDCVSSSCLCDQVRQLYRLSRKEIALEGIEDELGQMLISQLSALQDKGRNLKLGRGNWQPAKSTNDNDLTGSAVFKKWYII